MTTYQRIGLTSHTSLRPSQPMYNSNVSRSPPPPLSHSYLTTADFIFILLPVLSCASAPGEQIRVLVNDGPVPLSPLKYCPDEDQYGLCPVDGFVSSLKEIIQETDFDWACNGNYTLPDGDAWQTVNGTPPAKPANPSFQTRDFMPENKRWEWLRS